MHLHDILKKLSAKTYFDASFMCFLDLLHFVSLLTVYVVERKFVAYCHAYVMGNGPKLADWSNDPVLHFEVVFVVC